MTTTKKAMKKNSLTKTRKPKSNPKRTLELLTMFLKMISEVYALDDLFPGVTFSYIADKGLYYASLCRYDRPSATRTIMLSATEPTIADCLDELIQQWRAHNKNTITLTESIRVRNPVSGNNITIKPPEFYMKKGLEQLFKESIKQAKARER